MDLEDKVEREFFLWRASAFLGLLMLICIFIMSLILSSKWRNEDNIERQKNWTQIKEGIVQNKEIIKITDERERAMIMQNFKKLELIDEHLRQCYGCHGKRRSK